jgi:hypothetical protein
MPHDRKGKPLEPGDRVLIPAVVKSVQASEEYCNVTMVTEEPMPPYTEGSMLTLNTRQVEKVETP